MKKVALAIAIISAIQAMAFCEAGSVSGICSKGSTKASISGMSSSNVFDGIVPSCLVSVYVDGKYQVNSASYISGGTVSGSSGNTCSVTISGGTSPATGTVILSGTNSISSGASISISSAGEFSSPPTTAVLSNGTATCSGTAVVSPTMGAARAVLYSDSAGTPLGNPFTATSIGQWGFFADITKAYDVVLSGGISPNTYSAPYSWGTRIYAQSSREVATFPGAIANECVGTDASGNFVSTGSPCGTGGSGGGVTSVGLSMPSIFSVSNSPVTTAGVIGVSLSSQLENLIFASPNGASGTPSFRRIVNSDLPFTYSGSTAEIATVLGTTPTNEVAAWDANGNLTASTSSSVFPGIYTGTISSSQVSGLAASATTDTTNASNISSGTLSASRMPSSSFACPSGQFVTSFTINNVSTLSCVDPGTITGNVSSGAYNSMPYYSSSPSGRVVSASSATLDSVGNMTAKTLQLSSALTLSSLAASSTGCLYVDSAGNVNSTGYGCGINGTVSSVGIAAPSIFSVTNTPVTSSGVITISANSELPYSFYSGPSSGSDSAVPTFRSMTLADLPLPASANLVLASLTSDPGSSRYSPVYRSLDVSDMPPASGLGQFLASPSGGSIYKVSYRAISTADLPSAIFKTTPTQCSGGNVSTGIDVYGNANCSSAGAVTSVGFTAPSIFTVTGSPITTSGTIGMSLNAVSGHYVLIGADSSSGTSTPAFRSLVNADLPTTLTASTTGNAATATAFAATPTVCSGEYATGIDSKGNAICSSGGSVTSVGLSMPTIFTVTGSPITSSGTLTASLNNADANTFLGGPATGDGAVPTFRALSASDIPSSITSSTTGTASNVTGTVSVSHGGTGASTASGALTNLGAASISSNTFTGAQTAPTFNATTGIEVNGSYGTSGQCFLSTGTGSEWGACASGVVTSVGLSAPSIFSVSGSPVTSSGTIALGLATEATNVVFAGPSSGSAAAPTFRSITNADLPSSLTASTTGNAATATAFASVPSTCTLNSVSYGIAANGDAYCSTDRAAFLGSNQTFSGQDTFAGNAYFESNAIFYSQTTGTVATFTPAQVSEYSTTVNVLKLTIPTLDELYITGGVTHVANNLTVDGTTLMNGPLNVGGNATMNVTDFKAATTIDATNTATSSNNYGSVSLGFGASYYDSSSAVQSPKWSVASAIGSGTTPENDLVFSFSDTGSGVSGHKVILPSIKVTNLSGTGCLYADSGGNVTANGVACGTEAGGTVSSFSAGALSPIFTTSVATASTTPALTFSLSNAAAHTFLGNNTGATAAPAYESITSADLPSDTAYLDAAQTWTAAQTFNANTSIGSSHTLAVGSLTASRCVRSTTGGVLVSADEDCQEGTVTSVTMTVPSQLTVTGSPITTSGTFALGVNGTGTGVKLVTASTAGTSGNAAVWTSNGDIGDGGALPQGSVQSVGLSLPSDFTVSGSPVTATGTLSAVWANTPTGTGSIVRQTSPTLVTPNIGAATASSLTDTGAAASSGTACLQINSSGVVSNTGSPCMANPMTTEGDIIYSSDNSGTPARLAAGTAGYVLQSNGTGAAPSWVAASGGGGGTLTSAVVTSDITVNGTIGNPSSGNATNLLTLDIPSSSSQTWHYADCEFHMSPTFSSGSESFGLYLSLSNSPNSGVANDVLVSGTGTFTKTAPIAINSAGPITLLSSSTSVSGTDIMLWSKIAILSPASTAISLSFGLTTGTTTSVSMSVHAGDTRCILAY